ncbi:hypothetical protein ML462_16040 [Gramella lutea]|uniref:Lipocalin-like domain-containing protein n=1 Tax=Christiangramia lutea TaxID=1607951 RepID=A0A9X2ACR2_9FLAO|nr:hypothetical protein [Christiangramia lutea]MCH4824682.1 hypothetical protein [Christiangramia lutea]
MKSTYKLLILAITFISCSTSDDNNKIDTEESLIGTWSTIQSKLNGNTVTSQEKVKFTSNRATFYYSDNITEEGDYTKSGNTITITWDDSDPGLENYTLKINELTATELKWETVISGEGTLEESLEK